MRKPRSPLLHAAPGRKRARIVAGRRQVQVRIESEKLVEDDLPSTEVSPPQEPAPGIRSRSGRRLSASLAVAAALMMTGAGTVSLMKSRAAQTGEGIDNAALLNTGATAEVSGQVSDAMEKLFSYSYDKIAGTEQTAAEVLAGPARAEYSHLLDQAKAQAPGQKLVLTSKAVVTGVRQLSPDSAHLLVFLDQAATRVDTGKSSGSAAAVSIDAERQGGRWKIVKLTPQ